MTQIPFRRILVTGGAGFIGSHLVDRLLAGGAEVAVVDNLDPFYDPAVKRAHLAAHAGHPAFRFFAADIRHGRRLLAVFRAVEPEAVVHLAARAGVRPSVRRPAPYMQVNVAGTAQVLEAARRTGVRHLIFASSSSVYGDTPPVPFREDGPTDPVSPYGAAKLAGEVLCAAYSRTYRLPVVALRLFSVYGPRMRPDLAIHKFARLLRAGVPLPLYGDGLSARDYTYVDDVVEGICRALAYRAFPDPDRPYRVFNLGSGRPVSLRELVAALDGVLGVRAVVRHLPAQAGDVRRTWADLSRARAELGYVPRVGLAEGLRRFAAWLDAAGAG